MILLFKISMKTEHLQIALRTCCAERICAMQLAACVHALNTCTVLFMRIYVKDDMEVQV